MNLGKPFAENLSRQHFWFLNNVRNVLNHIKPFYSDFEQLQEVQFQATSRFSLLATFSSLLTWL